MFSSFLFPPFPSLSHLLNTPYFFFFFGRNQYALIGLRRKIIKQREYLGGYRCLNLNVTMRFMKLFLCLKSIIVSEKVPGDGLTIKPALGLISPSIYFFPFKKIVLALSSKSMIDYDRLDLEDHRHRQISKSGCTGYFFSYQIESALFQMRLVKQSVYNLSNCHNFFKFYRLFQLARLWYRTCPGQS